MRRRYPIKTAFLATGLSLFFAHQLAAEGIEDLVKAARKEGKLNVMSLNRDWCGYGALIDSFSATYEIKVTDLNPDAGSADQLDLLRKSITDPRLPSPDVLDIDPMLIPKAKADKLLMTYKLQSNWNDVPEAAKDPDFAWVTGYYGVIGFQINSELVTLPPRDWSELAAPEYVDMVALAGDPKLVRQAWLAVYGAGLSANDGDQKTAVESGLAFFKALHVKGNFSPVAARAAHLANGQAPIILRWDYNARADRILSGDKPKSSFILPDSGSIAGTYVQAIAINAEHPNAAKLWMEHYFSDEGQLALLKGGCLPVRFLSMAESGDIPPDLLKTVPPVPTLKKTVFLMPDALVAARDAIAAGWDSVVGVPVN